MRGKIANATPLTYNKIKFKSKLEVFMYKQLRAAKIKFDYEKQTFVLIEGFTYMGKKLRPITYTPDFVLKDYSVIIETKGFMTEVFRIKMKLFKWMLSQQKDDRLIYTPRNQKDCLEVINKIKKDYKL